MIPEKIVKIKCYEFISQILLLKGTWISNIINFPINIIGYGINKMDLINNNYNINQSSIQTLAKGSPGEDLITGEKSFGAFMEREGYCALPSPINPKPGEKKYRNSFAKL